MTKRATEKPARDRILAVPLNVEERAALEQYASHMGMPMTAVVRSWIRKHATIAARRK